MNYLAINFVSETEIRPTIEKLLSLQYVFSEKINRGERRLREVEKIVSLLRPTNKCAILLGRYDCMMEWEIFQQTFYTDGQYIVLTLDQFLTNHREFQPEPYLRKFPSVQRIAPTVPVPAEPITETNTEEITIEIDREMMRRMMGRINRTIGNR